jgi:hypothetical protein
MSFSETLLIVVSLFCSFMIGFQITFYLCKKEFARMEIERNRKEKKEEAVIQPTPVINKEEPLKTEEIVEKEEIKNESILGKYGLQ